MYKRQTAVVSGQLPDLAGLLDAFAKEHQLKYEISTVDEETYTAVSYTHLDVYKRQLSVFFILLAFLGFSQVFSSVMTQMIERMFETIGLHSPTPDLGDTIERSWTMLLYAGFFGPITEEFFFRGAGLRGLEQIGRAHV